MSRATTALCDASTCRRDVLLPTNEWKTHMEVTWIGVCRFHVTLLKWMDGWMDWCVIDPSQGHPIIASTTKDVAFHGARLARETPSFLVRPTRT